MVSAEIGETFMKRAISSARFAALLIALAGCAPAYTPGALFETPDTRTLATRRRGCVDIQVRLASDEHLRTSSALVVYELANACDEGHTVDLSRAHVTGRSARGETKLVSYDAELQRRAAVLDGRRTGSEAVRYDAPVVADAFDTICVDLREVAPAPGPDDGFGVVCLEAPGEREAAARGIPGVVRALGGCPSERPNYSGPSDCLSRPQEWSNPMSVRLRVDTGLGFHVTPTSRLTLDRAGSDSVSAAPIGDVTTGTVDLRMLGYVSRAIYTGGELDVGAGGNRAAPLGGGVGSKGFAGNVTLGAVVGAASIRSGALQLRGELFAGGRLLLVAAADPSQVGGGPAFVGASWMLEPRAAVDLWVAPDVTLGAWAGADVLTRGAWSTGLAIALHTRSFDAR